MSCALGSCQVLLDNFYKNKTQTLDWNSVFCNVRNFFSPGFVSNQCFTTLVLQLYMNQLTSQIVSRCVTVSFPEKNAHFKAPSSNHLSAGWSISSVELLLSDNWVHMWRIWIIFHGLLWYLDQIFQITQKQTSHDFSIISQYWIFHLSNFLVHGKIKLKSCRRIRVTAALQVHCQHRQPVKLSTVQTRLIYNNVYKVLTQLSVSFLITELYTHKHTYTHIPLHTEQ